MNQVLQLANIDCIIFDLGKVLINLDTERTQKAFKSIYGEKFEGFFNALSQEGFFDAYETGKISSQSFLSRLQAEAPHGTAESDIRKAWNAMLLDFPPQRFDLLLRLKSQFKTLCLSNTNEIHIAFIEEVLKKQQGTDTLDPYFEQVYYSHEMGLRKPEPEIFQVLIDEHQLKPSRTLFIDDTAGHLIGAKETGLQTRHFKADDSIELLIPNY